MLYMKCLFHHLGKSPTRGEDDDDVDDNDHKDDGDDDYYCHDPDHDNKGI